MIRDPALRVKAEDLMAQCRKKLNIADDEKAANDKLFTKTLPSALHSSAVNPHTAFVVTSIVSPRLDDDDGADGAKTPTATTDDDDATDATAASTTAAPTKAPSSADKLNRTKSIGSRMSKLFGLKNDGKKKESNTEGNEGGKTPDKKEKGKKKEKKTGEVSEATEASEVSIATYQCVFFSPFMMDLSAELHLSCVGCTWTRSLLCTRLSTIRFSRRSCRRWRSRTCARRISSFTSL